MDQDNPRYDPSIRKHLDQEDWPEALGQAYKYAFYKTQFLNLFDFRLDPEELVSESIALSYGVGSGKFGKKTYRNWNREKCPSLANFLKSTIKSLISHICQKNQGRSYSFLINDDGDEINKLELELHQKTNISTPEGKNILSQEAECLLGFLDNISNEDIEIGMLLVAADDGHQKASEQAEVTGYEIQKIYNIRKRLRRRLNDFLVKQYPEKGGTK